MGTLATKLVLLPPRDPSPRAWWSGATVVRDLVHARPLVHLADRLHAQFAEWLTGANARVVRTIKAAPVDLIDN
jgi:hypothetical protein